MKKVIIASVLALSILPSTVVASETSLFSYSCTLKSGEEFAIKEKAGNLSFKLGKNQFNTKLANVLNDPETDDLSGRFHKNIVLNFKHKNTYYVLDLNWDDLSEDEINRKKPITTLPDMLITYKSGKKDIVQECNYSKPSKFLMAHKVGEFITLKNINK